MAERAPRDFRVVGSNPISGYYETMTFSITHIDGYVIHRRFLISSSVYVRLGSLINKLFRQLTSDFLVYLE